MYTVETLPRLNPATAYIIPKNYATIAIVAITMAIAMAITISAFAATVVFLTETV